MGWKKPYAGLQAELRGLPDDAGKVQLLGVLQGWLRANQAEFGAALQQKYGLDEYALMDLRRYPVDRTALNVSEEIRQLMTVPPASLETLAMRVRDVFWSGVTVEAGVQCPRCGDTELRVLHDIQSGEPVLACDLCTWAQKINKQQWQGTSRLVPPMANLLDQWSDLLKEHA